MRDNNRINADRIKFKDMDPLADNLIPGLAGGHEALQHLDKECQTGYTSLG
ncbi:hypothetical protein [Dyadobacter sp. CY356]|uniref:hypothetical protein n=1 Tax=Dyadobacter sp. CY356 TaxID=2906442 RepID=UPI001F1E815A|nr:hypothetical protein [Dyadobacter sp. CY356]MCF0055247.1 hypothetical protein [Dyadobacter sp. CY356]